MILKYVQPAVCLCLLRFIGYPGNYKTLFGVRNEDVSLSHECIDEDCDDDDDDDDDDEKD